MFVEISLGKKNLKVPCKNEAKDSLLKIAEKLNEKISNISKKIDSKDDDLLIAMTALLLQEEILLLNSKNTEITNLEHNSNEYYNEMSKNLEKACKKIDDLSQKIKNL
jgi:cell division protein ZapA (FtsZ GTPase activity inhibitor)